MTSGVMSPDSSPAVLASLAFGTVFPIFKYVVGISIWENLIWLHCGKEMGSQSLGYSVVKSRRISVDESIF